MCDRVFSKYIHYVSSLRFLHHIILYNIYTIINKFSQKLAYIYIYIHTTKRLANIFITLVLIHLLVIRSFFTNARLLYVYKMFIYKSRDSLVNWFSIQKKIYSCKVSYCIDVLLTNDASFHCIRVRG